jgi:hypothetical protein
MDQAKDILWGGVQPLLLDFAERIAASDSAVIYSVKSTSNDAFLIRGYASLRKTASEDEIAVVVDGLFKDGEIVLSADACLDDGEILADGPETAMPLSAMLSLSGTPLAEWLGRFEDFLASIEAVVKERVAAL